MHALNPIKLSSYNTHLIKKLTDNTYTSRSKVLTHILILQKIFNCLIIINKTIAQLKIFSNLKIHKK